MGHTKASMASIMLLKIIVAFSLVCCQTLPRIERIDGDHVQNNSFVYYANISDDIHLKCRTDNENCCNSSHNATWRDERGEPVQEGAGGAHCFYVTREEREIRLYRNESCIPETSGLWRCDIPDSNGTLQSLYLYISHNKTFGKSSTVQNSKYYIAHCNRISHSHSAERFLMYHFVACSAI